MLTKEDYEKALENLKIPTDGWECNELQLAENNNEPIEYQEQESIDTIEQLIKEHFELVDHAKNLQNKVDKYKHEYYSMLDLFENPEPYKFEDLKPNMWVWDDFYDRMLFIIEFTCNNCLKTIYFERDSFGEYYPCIEAFSFELNRYYTPTKAMQYQ